MSLRLHTRRAVLVAWCAALGCSNLIAAQARTPRYQVIKYLDGMGSTALIEGKDGSLYGTLETAGRKGEGVVFKLERDGSGYTVLHHFTGCRDGGDGSNPQGVVEGSDGALYGTTKFGGIPGGTALEAAGMSGMGNGTVFKVNRDGNGYGLLRSFTCRDGDGSMPHAGLVEGRDGQIYGTTFDGGSGDNGVYPGTVFTLSHDGSRYQVLNSFGTNAALGARPWADLMAGSDGSLYGTTGAGGAGGQGTVFKLNTDGSGYTAP